MHTKYCFRSCNAKVEIWFLSLKVHCYNEKVDDKINTAYRNKYGKEISLSPTEKTKQNKTPLAFLRDIQEHRWDFTFLITLALHHLILNAMK